MGMELCFAVLRVILTSRRGLEASASVQTFSVVQLENRCGQEGVEPKRSLYRYWESFKVLLQAILISYRIACTNLAMLFMTGVICQLK